MLIVCFSQSTSLRQKDQNHKLTENFIQSSEFFARFLL